jgi:16S rRNA (cytosine967-C5)-methyltransferase
MMSVRQAAARVLLAVEAGRATLGAEVDRARTAVADDRDRALLVELTAGTLRWRGELDALLDQCSRRPVADLDAGVRTAVRLGAYQLEHLDRIPVHAVVHESVELVRALNRPQAAGFVNAVLRSLARDRATLRLPARPPADAPKPAQIAYLATTLSHPEWLVSRWLARVGFDAAEAWCQFNNSTPDVTVRSMGRLTAGELRGALEAAAIPAEPVKFVRDAFRLPSGSAGRIPPDLRGEILMQDEASQIVAHAVGATAGDRVLDLCAAPGGKTIVMASDLGVGPASPGPLIAADRRRGRVALLRATIRRADVRVPVVMLDATHGLPFGAVFDRVLLDAPCSGLGTIRRDPDLKWSRRETELPAFAATQLAMLRRAAETVRPGGTLVYATCSSEPDENDQVVDAFLTADPRFEPSRADPGSLVADGHLVDPRGFLRTTPFAHGLDAFFAAALVRRRAA